MSLLLLERQPPKALNFLSERIFLPRKRPKMFEIVNAKGAAKKLGCSVTWIHKLVSTGKLKAYIYDEKGTLIIRPPGEKRQGQGLYFFVSDLDAFQEERKPG